ncbi:MAG: hypothetical protein IPL46_29965 [Saprospiraceae bacterium]|nr:hypothetical protein [Saprospiraceae bacterium]
MEFRPLSILVFNALQRQDYPAYQPVGRSDAVAIVCAQHGHLFRMKIQINLEGVSPLWAGVTP